MKSINVKRQEIKYFFRDTDLHTIKDILSFYMIIDSNCKNNTSYKLSSLYFDSFFNDDLNQKLNGVINRKKYRLRFYNDNFINGKFEIKRKFGNTISKSSLPLDKKQTLEILNNDFSSLLRKGYKAEAYELIQKIYRPKSLVTYERIAFTLPYNQIRITIDSNLRTHGYNFNLKNNLTQGISLCPKGHQIMEIKFCDSIPKIILDALSSFFVSRTAISKYTSSRIFSSEDRVGDVPYFSW